MRTWVDDWGHTINIMFPKKNLVKLSLEDAKSLVSELEYQIKIAKEMDKTWKPLIEPEGVKGEAEIYETCKYTP